MRLKAAALSGVCVFVLALSGCGGGSSSSGGPAPTPAPAPAPATGTTVGIVGEKGNQSFTPNPAPLGTPTTVAWKNNDGQTHRIVANDGSFDTGNIPAGATSTAIQMSSNGTNYHCSIHPTMIGSVSGTGGAPPPCSGIYCDK